MLLYTVTHITPSSDACRLRRAMHEVGFIPVCGRKKANWDLGRARVTGGFMIWKFMHGGIAALVAGLGVFLVLRVYIVQELLAALFLFSLVFAAVALFCFALVLLDWFSQALVLKMQSAVCGHAALAQPLFIFREYGRRKYSFAVHHHWGH
jgi:hypothetical protein